MFDFSKKTPEVQAVPLSSRIFMGHAFDTIAEMQKVQEFFYHEVEKIKDWATKAQQHFISSMQQKCDDFKFKCFMRNGFLHVDVNGEFTSYNLNLVKSFTLTRDPLTINGEIKVTLDKTDAGVFEVNMLTSYKKIASPHQSTIKAVRHGSTYNKIIFEGIDDYIVVPNGKEQEVYDQIINAIRID